VRRLRIIKVRVIPSASKEKIVEEEDSLKVYLTSPPQKGKANKRLLEIISKYFHLKKSSLKIVKGTTSSNKLIQIIDED